jgi:hypothetical protein
MALVMMTIREKKQHNDKDKENNNDKNREEELTRGFRGLSRRVGECCCPLWANVRLFYGESLSLRPAIAPLAIDSACG